MGESFELLRILADGKPHPLEVLARTLAVEPDRVLLRLRELDELGVSCLKVQQGWQWLDPVELLESEQITERLGRHARGLLAGLKVLGEVDSTNRFLMDAARSGAQTGYACVAEFQSKGQGRRGRGFVSPIGNIYQSVLWRFEQDTAFLSGLSVAIGVVDAET